MKHIYQILLIVFILHSLIYSQWNSQTISLPRGDYKSVYMLDDSVGWIAGSILLKTTNSGNTWLSQTFNNEEEIFDVKFLDNSTGFAQSVLNNRLVYYKSLNGGNDWIIENTLDSISISEEITFNKISISTLEDSIVIWCTGYNSNTRTGFVYYSIDKSKTWKLYDKLSPYNSAIDKITFIDSSTGFFSTWEKLFRTTDSGDTWQQCAFDSVGITHFLNYQFFNPDTGYFVAMRDPAFFSPLFIGKTYNGGESWTVDSTAKGFFPNLSPLVIIYFANPNLGFAVEWTKNFVLRTTDGGSNWIKYISPNPAPLLSIHSSDGKTVVAAGHNSQILVSKDSGSTWNDLTPPAEINFKYIKYFSNNFVIAFDGSNVYHSFDSCNTWAKHALPTGLDICITMLDSQNGWIADDSSRIYNTSNSGITWNLQREFNYLDPNTTLDPLKGIYFFDENFGCSVGGNGYITATTNGGENWESKVSPISTTLNGVFVASINKAWAVGESGTILTTSDTCNSWTTQDCPINTTLRSVTFTDTLNGYILGDNGTFLKTTDGGQLWQLAASLNSTLNAMRFVSTSAGWIAADNGKIFRTVDGGEHWETQESGVQSNLTSMDFIDNYSGIVVGENGIILTTSNGGVTSSLENENHNALPKTFELKQNFPNPFNPITKISFSLPSNEFAVLKIYDILGRVITTLVSEEKSAGTYSINFDASKLASGVYIYKIQAGNFINSKKMILLK